MVTRWNSGMLLGQRFLFFFFEAARFLISQPLSKLMNVRLKNKSILADEASAQREFLIRILATNKIFSGDFPVENLPLKQVLILTI